MFNVYNILLFLYDVLSCRYRKTQDEVEFTIGFCVTKTSVNVCKKSNFRQRSRTMAIYSLPFPHLNNKYVLLCCS